MGIGEPSLETLPNVIISAQAGVPTVNPIKASNALPNRAMEKNLIRASGKPTHSPYFIQPDVKKTEKARILRKSARKLHFTKLATFVGGRGGGGRRPPWFTGVVLWLSRFFLGSGIAAKVPPFGRLQASVPHSPVQEKNQDSRVGRVLDAVALRAMERGTTHVSHEKATAFSSGCFAAHGSSRAHLLNT